MILDGKSLKSYGGKTLNSMRIPLKIKKLRDTIDKVLKLKGVINNFYDIYHILLVFDELVD